MAHRVGVCGSCRARFQIPATFTPNQARCRTCGGVVDIGPAHTTPQEAAVKAAPTPAPPQAQPTPPPRPAPVEAPVSRAPAGVGERATTPAPDAEAVRPKPARSPSPVTTFAAPKKKRGVFVPALVAAGVLAVLIFGAFQLLGHRDSVAASTPAQAPENEDATRTPEPKAQSSAAEDSSTPR